MISPSLCNPSLCCCVSGDNASRNPCRDFVSSLWTGITSCCPPLSCWHFSCCPRVDVRPQASTFDLIRKDEVIIQPIRMECLSEEEIIQQIRSVKIYLEKQWLSEGQLMGEILKNLSSLNRTTTRDVLLIFDNYISPALKDLQIGCHDLRNTLEVTLGLTRTLVLLYQKGSITEDAVFLGVIASLFHDIGYSNAHCILNLHDIIKREGKYKKIVLEARGEDFVRQFTKILDLAKQNKPLSGAEFHSYHVYLGQLLFSLWLETSELALSEHNKLLLHSSEMAVQSIIALTDLTGSPTKHQKEIRDFLDSQGLLLVGEALVASDLFAHFSSTEKWNRGLELFREIRQGGEGSSWASGLEFLSSIPKFYRDFAEHKIHSLPEVVQVLEEFNYDNLLDLVLLLYSTYEFVYAKVKTGAKLETKDLAIIALLEETMYNTKILTPIFSAIGKHRDNQSLGEELKETLLDLLEHPTFNLVVGDEIRISLLVEALMMGDPTFLEYLDTSIYHSFTIFRSRKSDIQKAVPVFFEKADVQVQEKLQKKLVLSKKDKERIETEVKEKRGIKMPILEEKALKLHDILEAFGDLTQNEKLVVGEIFLNNSL